jgi:hypothetical protein
MGLVISPTAHTRTIRAKRVFSSGMAGSALQHLLNTLFARIVRVWAVGLITRPMFQPVNAITFGFGRRRRWFLAFVFAFAFAFPFPFASEREGSS